MEARQVTGARPLPRIRFALAPAAAVALSVALLAQAATVLVVPNDASDAIYAERFTLTLQMGVVGTSIAQALLDRDPIGTQAQPIELTELMTPAGTSLKEGNWVYEVTVRERAVDSVAKGVFVVEASLDGQSLGEVWVNQSLPNPLLKEGARVAFDLGAEEPEAPMFVVTLRRPVDESGSYRLQSVLGADLKYRWKGVGGDIEGLTNPTLTGKVNEAMEITIVNGDGTAAHNLVIKDASGAVVAGPTPDVEDQGDEETLPWTPGAPGTYTYVCQYHANSQLGEINVTT